jgi:hypothetical protein
MISNPHLPDPRPQGLESLIPYGSAPTGNRNRVWVCAYVAKDLPYAVAGCSH